MSTNDIIYLSPTDWEIIQECTNEGWTEAEAIAYIMEIRNSPSDPEYQEFVKKMKKK